MEEDGQEGFEETFFSSPRLEPSLVTIEEAVDRYEPNRSDQKLTVETKETVVVVSKTYAEQIRSRRKKQMAVGVLLAMTILGFVMWSVLSVHM